MPAREASTVYATPNMELKFVMPLFRRGTIALIVGLAFAAGLRGEDEGVARGSADEITFQFLPPPIDEARYSIGVFDAKGKLVRRLHEGTIESAFPAALNGLIVRWNAKDDAGRRLQNGHYQLRGYAVGPMKVSGVATKGNDWLADDPGLRVTAVDAIVALPSNALAALVRCADGRAELICVRDGRLAWHVPVDAVASRGEATLGLGGDEFIVVSRGGKSAKFRIDSGAAVESGDSAAGRLPSADGWKLENGRLAQHSPDGPVVRQWQPAAGEPAPVGLAPDGPNRIYLIERNSSPAWERLRGIEASTTSGGGPSAAEWRTFFERNIRVPEKFDAPAAAATLRIDLVKNPLGLRRGGQPSLTLQAMADDRGSYLGTTDGLRLRQVSAVKSAKAVAMTRGEAKGSIRFFQRDAAASEEFLIEGIDRIMAFEVGSCEINERGEVLPEGEAPEPK